MGEIDLNEIAQKYNSISEIWSKKDNWHRNTHFEIARFIKKMCKKRQLYLSSSILNAGSGGNSYGLPEEKMIHIDIAKRNIQNKLHFIVASIEDIPLPNRSCDLVLCVGSVINYCDPIKVINEFARLLNRDSYVILEFENSASWEFLGTKNFNRTAAIITTFYNGREEKLWVYSSSYIKKLLRINDFSIVKCQRFHLLSSLIYRFTRNEYFSSHFKVLDRIVNCMPLAGRISSNMIILAQKL